MRWITMTRFAACDRTTRLRPTVVTACGITSGRKTTRGPSRTTASPSKASSSQRLVVSPRVTDGYTYSYDCQCPQGVCSCGESSSSGGSSSGTMNFTGCQVSGCISGAAAWSLCNFPH
jgi:hypothetical protein